jgi:hypothetical protein
MSSAPSALEAVDRQEGNKAWIAPARIIRDGQRSGSGIYYRAGLIITAAHLTAAQAKMSVEIAGIVLPAAVVKQGSFEEVDLTVLQVNEQQIPPRILLPQVPLCEAPPWPGDEVIVVDADRATRSHIVSPQVIPFVWRSKFSSLIADVATTGNSGSGVFDPKSKCLLGIMSRKFTSSTAQGGKDIAKYFVPAAEIRAFIPSELIR